MTRAIGVATSALTLKHLIQVLGEIFKTVIDIQVEMVNSVELDVVLVRSVDIEVQIYG